MNRLRELKRGRVILVTGTPGTGKTIIGRLLASSLKARYVNPQTLLTREGIDYTYDEDRRTRIVSLKRLGASLQSVARRADQAVIVDSHISFKMDASLMPKRVIVLRCDPIVLESRLKRKRWSRRKISENVLAEILDLCLYDAVHNFGRRRVSEIDTSNKRPSEVVEEAVRALERGPIQQQSKVDWLASLKRRGLLTRYLR